MQEGTKKIIIWETNSEPPRNYIWVKDDGLAYEYDWDIREWIPSKSLDGAGSTKLVSKTTAEWNASVGYIPANGEIIVYTDYKTVDKDGVQTNVPGIKIGSGNAYVQDLAFVGENVESGSYAPSQIAITLEEHMNDHVIHTNANEREFWNNKVSIDASALSAETLKFKID